MEKIQLSNEIGSDRAGQFTTVHRGGLLISPSARTETSQAPKLRTPWEHETFQEQRCEGQVRNQRARENIQLTSGLTGSAFIRPH